MRGLTIKSRGFTLIELMIVVAILNVLVSIAIPQYLRFQMKARRADAVVTLNAVHKHQIGNLVTDDGFYTQCAPNMSECSYAGNTAKGKETNRMFGFGNNFVTTRHGYTFLYHFKRSSVQSKWTQYSLTLTGNLDRDPFLDALFIFFQDSSLTVPASMEGIPILAQDDLADLTIWSIYTPSGGGGY